MYSRSGRVLRIAHGGTLNASQANSLEGIYDAIAAGVDGIEVDVQATCDGEAVLFHDSFLHINQRSIQINDVSFSELETINAAANRSRILPLKEMLDRLRNTDNLILLDIKSRYVIDEVMRLVHDANATEKILIASFDYVPLSRAKVFNPTIPTIVTIGFSRGMTKPLQIIWTLFALLFPLRATKSVRASAILCPAYRMTRRLVRRAHKRGIAVFVWKLSDKMKASYSECYNVDGLVCRLTSDCEPDG